MSPQKKIAKNLILRLCIDDFTNDIFKWQTIYENIVNDLTAIGLQADVFYNIRKFEITIPAFSRCVNDLMIRRAEQLHHFLKKIINTVDEFFRSIDTKPRGVTLKFLEADSHNQGERGGQYQFRS